MCNITYLRPGIEVPEAEIENAASWNDDGHGWAIAAETGVMLTGRYMDVDTALTTFVATRRAFPNAHAMFHSRWATHGTVGLSNVHPFSVGKYAAVAHNGILPGKFQPAKDQSKSDTAILAAYWLAGRSQTAGVWTRKERRRIASIIGTGNKLCILSVSPFLPEPTAYLIHAGQGTWDTVTGAWFSSDSYKSLWTPTKKYTGTGGWLWDGDEYGEWRKGDDGTWGRVVKDNATCPCCKHSEGLDPVSNVCLRCDTCLDCFEPLRNCQCYYGSENHGDQQAKDDALAIALKVIGVNEETSHVE